MTEFFNSIVDLITSIIEIISDTAIRIDAIQFNETVFADWLGYARYAMGDPLYIMFTSVVLITIGVTMWTYILKGIGYIKNLLPW